MSKHRATNRSALRFAPFGAGVTVALLAAGTGSAFAVPAVDAPPTTKPTCDEATKAASTAQSEVTRLTAARDAAERELRQARAEVRKAQASYRDALEGRDDAKERLESREDRQERKQAAFERAQSRVTELEKLLAEKKTNQRAVNSAKRDLARATAELTAAKAETAKAGDRLKKKEDALKLVNPASQDQRDAVTTAATNLKLAEEALAGAKEDRRTARAARTEACTSNIL